MDYTLSEEQEMLKKATRDFLADRCKKTVVRAMEQDEKGYPPDLWADMAELGWMGLVLPEKYGGSAMSFSDLTVLLEEMGRACMPGPFFSTVILGGMPILEFGSEKQKDEYLPKMAQGKLFLTLALTEAGGQYEASSVKTTAQAADGGYILSGSKLFVPDAHVADYMLVVARTDAKAAPEKGITIFIVDGKSKGITRNAMKSIASDKLFEVIFDRVKVPAENILGKPNQGWDIVKRVLQQAAIAKCCEMVGGMQQVLDMTVDYAKERKQFGKPIGTFQIIQHYCTQMATDVDGSRFIAYQAASRLSKGLPHTKEVAMAKAWVGEAYGRVATLAHEIHGAIGCTIDHDLGLYTRRGKAGELTWGTSDFHREIVAQEMGL